MTDLFGNVAGIERDALIDGPYRYMASRHLTGGPTAMFVGVNPSKACGTWDDHTVRKLYGFGARTGIGSWLIGNKFAYRSPQVGILAHVDDPIGAHNDAWLSIMATQADLVILGWGPLTKLPKRLRGRWHVVIDILEAAHRKPLLCWGQAKDGQPLHPLMLGYDSPLQPWQRPEAQWAA